MPAAANTSPSPASARLNLCLRHQGLASATSAPRKRRDAAPRSGYGKPHRPCHGFQPARNRPYWPDMQETQTPPLIKSLAKWILACVVLLGIAAPGTNAWAQVNPNAN